jgi:hypothetical protein
MSERILPPKRPPAPSITYAEWRKRARERLAGPTSMREKAWTRAFIIGKTPDEAADQVRWLAKAGKDEETHRSRYGRSASTRAGRRVPSA